MAPLLQLLGFSLQATRDLDGRLGPLLAGRPGQLIILVGDVVGNNGECHVRRHIFG